MTDDIDRKVRVARRVRLLLELLRDPAARLSRHQLLASRWKKARGAVEGEIAPPHSTGILSAIGDAMEPGGDVEEATRLVIEHLQAASTLPEARRAAGLFDQKPGGGPPEE